MNDIIYRQAVLDAIEKAMCEDGFRSATGLIHKTTAYDIIRHLPSAQSEIIRCKDCIYFDKGYDEDTADWCHVWSEATCAEGYCHNAERGDEQDE